MIQHLTKEELVSYLKKKNAVLEEEFELTKTNKKHSTQNISEQLKYNNELLKKYDQ